MNIKAMNMFLSEVNIMRHAEYLRNIRLKLSILEKSVPHLRELAREETFMSIKNKDLRKEAYELLTDISCHECFFSSFVCTPSNKKITSLGKTREALLYDIYFLSMQRKGGFACVYIDRGSIKIGYWDNTTQTKFIRPILAIDLDEHSYFYDYGFDKDRYIRTALTYLDTDRLNNLDNQI